MDRDDVADYSSEDDQFSAFDKDYQQNFSWKQLREDEYGQIKPIVNQNKALIYRQRRQSTQNNQRIKKGMMRYLEVILDLSEAVTMTDFRPNRLAVFSQVLQKFIREYFDQNPLSQIGLIGTNNGKGFLISELSGSPEHHISKLRGNLEASGNVSLQNALNVAIEQLSQVPPYGQKEVFVIISALTTCDPSDITTTIKTLAKRKIRCSFVSSSAEMYICKKISVDTQGSYQVAMDENGFLQQVMEFSKPPPLQAQPTLVEMGFPQHESAQGGGALAGRNAKPATDYYRCPRCLSSVVDLPNRCHVCGLILLASSHLARSYHHLFPVQDYQDVTSEDFKYVSGTLYHQKEEANQNLQSNSGNHINGLEENESKFVECYGCSRTLRLSQQEDSDIILRCRNCSRIFCLDCDVYIHESLHNCPGCECMKV